LIKEKGGVGHMARDHPLYAVLHDLANEETTSLNFREAIFASLLLRGNGYAKIDRGVDGHASSLWFLKPRQMEVKRGAGDKITYRYTNENGTVKECGTKEIFSYFEFFA
jgi:phage portal protein BeeE